MPAPIRRLAAGTFGLFLFLAASAAGAGARTDALVRLCEVWSTVKFHDPQLMLREVDWDGALVRAIPNVRQAQTSDDVARAIGSMLAELGDPATRVFRKEAARPAAENVPLLRWDGDVLIVSIGPYTDSVSEVPLLFSAVHRIASELAKAKVAVFDFRTRSGETPGWILDDLDLVSEVVAVPAWRHVVHSGYTPQEGPAIGGFHSSLQVVLPRPIAGSGSAVSVPARYVFIVGDGLPERAAALWWSGHAAIVSEHPVSDAHIARTKNIDLGGGWVAAVRVTESIAQGLAADAVVASSSQEDAAMAKAIAFARDPSPLPARPAPQLKATAPIAQVDAAYAEMSYPDLPYRLLGLFRLWSVVDRFYPFKDQIGDWQAVLTEFIPRFEDASDAHDYARAVLEVVARLEDGHSQAWGPAALWDVIGARLLPLELRSIEGRFIVTGRMEEVPKGSGVAIGDEVVSIDGEPLADRVRRLWKYYSASTEAARTATVLEHAGRGPRDSIAELVVRRADGATRTVKIARTRTPPDFPREGDIWRVLDGNIGYVDLGRLTGEQVAEMFTALHDTKALIFDMRGYPNATALSIAPRLNTNKATIGAIFRRRLVSEFAEYEPRTSLASEQPLPKTDEEIYQGRTVMLIDERSMSQAEWTGLWFEAANGTKFIGSNSAGAVGDPTTMVLPGGIFVRFTCHDVLHADGRPVQRIGLVPDVVVRPTVAGIRQGRDEVLERAVAYLNSGRRGGGGAR